MAKYRQVHITFWQDPFIEELEPLEKYFYLYLMTNSKTTQCGCYEISNKLIKYETGLKQSQIDEFIKLFIKEKKIEYDPNTREFLIINWLKHNSFRSPKVKTCITKELVNVKNTVFKGFIEGILENGIGIDSLSIDYKETIDTSSQQEQEEEQEQEDKINIEFSVFWDLYDLKTGKAESEKKWNKLKDVDRELIIKTLPLYVSETLGKNEVSNEFKPIRKNPTTYLNQKVWKDYEGFDSSHKEGLEKSDSVNSNIGITFL